jgi:hypothetical protein
MPFPEKPNCFPKILFWLSQDDGLGPARIDLRQRVAQRRAVHAAPAQTLRDEIERFVAEDQRKPSDWIVRTLEDAVAARRSAESRGKRSNS